MTTVPTSLFREGVLLRREALEFGISDRSLHGAVRAGLLVRIRQGAYADRRTWVELTPLERHRVLTAGVVRLYNHAVTVSHISAVVDHAGPTFALDLSCVHISHARGTARTQGKVHHHCADPRADDIVRADGRRVTSVARTVVQTTLLTRSVEVGIVLASYFLRKNMVTSDALVVARDEVDDVPGSLSLRAALGYARRELASVAEARCWYILCRGGLPQVMPQYRITDGSGRVLFWVDFAIPELGIFIEVDGKEKYLKHRRPGETLEEFLIRERRRENRICELTGWDVVRLTWADLAHPDRVIERILAVALRRARDRSSRTN